MRGPTGPCSQLPLAVILAPRARPRHNGFVVHAWLHRAGCRAVRTARSWRGIVAFTHLARGGRMTVTIGRRELLAALGGAAATWPLAVQAQQSASKMPRIGVIDPGAIWGDHFRQALRDLGYLEGRNIVIEYRSTEETPDRLAATATELAQLPVDVIVTFGSTATQAAKQATTTIPIVMI